MCQFVEVNQAAKKQSLLKQSLFVEFSESKADIFYIFDSSGRTDETSFYQDFLRLCFAEHFLSFS